MATYSGITKTASLELRDLTRLCQAWSDMGGAVQEQAQDLIDGGDVEDQNANAVGMIVEWLDQAATMGVDEAADLRDELSGTITSTREARRRVAALTEAERMAIVGEEGEATNAHRLDLTGTHYVNDEGMEIDWLWSI